VLITDLAVFERADRRSPFRLVETAPGISREEVRARTSAHYVG
jgi:acyl CoA:acetate/3-ketoacid CoA transferase beta subunit